MGMTIAEKIIAAAAGVPEVKPGDIHTVTLDRLMSNDGTTHLTVAFFFNSIMAAGFPTTRLRPTTTAFLPVQSMP